jgi:hypothetical protein
MHLKRREAVESSVLPIKNGSFAIVDPAHASAQVTQVVFQIVYVRFRPSQPVRLNRRGHKQAFGFFYICLDALDFSCQYAGTETTTADCDCDVYNGNDSGHGARVNSYHRSPPLN